MFTGIVKGVGSVSKSVQIGGDRRIRFDTRRVELGELKIGASIAVNGVCLTAVAPDTEGFVADVSQETLAVTTIDSLEPGSRVNIESSLALGDTLDGHWVTGHIDGVGRVVDVQPAARSTVLRIALPEDLSSYVARKGSIAVDGVSLTVNAVDGHEFEVNIVPHTRDMTIIAEYVDGTPVNIEVDIVARYIERLMHRA